MRTIEKTIFKFDELSDTAKEKAVSDWRFDDPTYLDSSFDLIVEVGEMLGFCFASRGKGEVQHDYSIGSYDDYYYAECSWAHRKGMLADVQKRWGHIHGEPVRKLAQTLHDCQKRFNWQLEVVASTSSYRRRSACIEVYRLNDQYGEDKRQPDQKLILDATDAVTGFFQWAEHLLKADWGFQHSSEYVIDMIEANECEFDENGAMA